MLSRVIAIQWNEIEHGFFKLPVIRDPESDRSKKGIYRALTCP